MIKIETLMKNLLFILVIYVIIYLHNKFKMVYLPQFSGSLTIHSYHNIPLLVFRKLNSYKCYNLIKEYHDLNIEKNRDCQFFWFDDKLEEHYMNKQPNEIYSCYKMLKPKTYRADLLRMCLLYEYGGIYLDSTIDLKKPIKTL